MKLIIVPAFRIKEDPPEVGDFYVRELLAEMEKQKALDGVEVDVDIGTPRRWTEGSTAAMPENILKRVKMYCDGSKYDAIVTTNGGDYGLEAARTISKVPVTGVVHSAIHVASLIGERFTVLYAEDKSALLVRRLVEGYGLGHKLAGARSFDAKNPDMWETLRKFKKGERGKTPKGEKIIASIVGQCIKGIEEDRADSVVLVGPHHSCFSDEVRQQLDEKGYGEIPLVLGVPAAVEMAKALVKMRLMQAARAYPSKALKARPSSR